MESLSKMPTSGHPFIKPSQLEKVEHSSSLTQKTAEIAKGALSNKQEKTSLPLDKKTSVSKSASSLTPKNTFESILRAEAIDFLELNPIKEEKDLDQIAITLRDDSPTKVLYIAQALWEKKDNSSLVSLAEKNVLQTKILELIEMSARKFIQNGFIEEAILARKEAAEISFSSFHPLDNLEKAITEKSCLIDTKTFGQVNLGAHFNKLDTSQLKGSNLRGVKKEVKYKDEIKSFFEFNFDLMPAYRERFNEQVKIIQEQQALYHELGLSIKVKSSTFEYRFFEKGLFLPENHAKNVKLGSSTEIQFQGIGKVIIGSDPAIWTNYNRVTIQIDSDKSLSDLQQMLTQLGLGSLLGVSSQNDREKIKLMYLFRAFYPKEAFVLERNPSFYENSIEEMKRQIILSNSVMEAFIEHFFPTMGETEILPGKIRYTIPALIDSAKDGGALGLVHEIAGEKRQDKIECLVGILKNGLIATQQRWDSGAFYQGQSSKADHSYGGADSVFARLVTKNTIEEMREEEKEELEESPSLSPVETSSSTLQTTMMNQLQEINDFFGKMEQEPEKKQVKIIEKPGRIVLQIKLKAVELNPYQYVYDNYGSRNPATTFSKNSRQVSYKDRLNLLDFILAVKETETDEEELMFKNRLAPNYFFGVVVSKQLKNEIIDRLQKENLLNVKNNVLCYQDIPIDEFILEMPSASEYEAHILKYS